MRDDHLAAAPYADEQDTSLDGQFSDPAPGWPRCVRRDGDPNAVCSLGRVQPDAVHQRLAYGRCELGVSEGYCESVASLQYCVTPGHDASASLWRSTALDAHHHGLILTQLKIAQRPAHRSALVGQYKG